MSGLVLLEHLASLIEGVSSKPKCVPDVGILKDIESDINVSYLRSCQSTLLVKGSMVD